MSVGHIGCTEQDIFWLDCCAGCYEPFPAAEPLVAHEATCIAYRDHIIEQKLAAQARDDGQEIDE